MRSYKVCQWLGGEIPCSEQPMEGKSYCSLHYNRAYIQMPTKMADHILGQEVDRFLKNKSSKDS